MQEQQAPSSQHSSACQRLTIIRCAEFVHNLLQPVKDQDLHIVQNLCEFRHNTTELSFARTARTVVLEQPDRVFHGVVV